MKTIEVSEEIYNSLIEISNELITSENNSDTLQKEKKSFRDKLKDKLADNETKAN